MNQLLEAALKYAALGWYVFPIKPGQKTPITAHGVKDATTDTEQINKWWVKWPDANVAVACGKESGIYVVDVDVTEDGSVDGYTSLSALPGLPATVMQYTPRGGCHAFYRTDDPPANKNSFLPGVDVRGDGYYVLLAPSIHPNGGQYTWSPGLAPWESSTAEYPDFLRPVPRPTAPEPAEVSQPAPAPQQSYTDAQRRASLYLAQCDSAIQGQAGHDKLLWTCGAMTWGCEMTEGQAYDILAREYNPRCVPEWNLADPKDEKDFRRKITESIKHPPSKPRGWILNDPAYASVPSIVTGLDVQKLLVNAGMAPADSLRGTSKAKYLPDEPAFQMEQFKQAGRAFTSTPLATPNPFPSWDASVPPETTCEQITEKMLKAFEKYEIKPPLQEKWENTTLAYGDAPTADEMTRKMKCIKQVDELKFITQPTGLAGELCSWINSTALKPQPYLTFGCVLAFLGTLFGRKVKDSLGSRTNLYVMSVAKSSAGKNHAMKKIRELCMASNCVNLLGGSNLASDTAIESRMSREPATLFLLDEIGHLLVNIKNKTSQHQSQIISLLMQLYSAASDVFLGREYADVENQRTIVHPCCCIYGVATPNKFAEGLSVSELDDGWLSRCLVFYEEHAPRKRRGTNLSIPPPLHVVELVSDWAKREITTPTDGKTISQFVVGSAGNFKEAPPEQIVVPTDADAERRFIAFDDMAELRGKESPEVARLWAKAEENARRIALILACSDSYEAPVITLASSDRACRVIEKIIFDFEKYVVPEIVSGRVESEKRKIINIVKRFGTAGCLKRDITQKTRWAGGRQRNDLLADILEAGDVICKQTLPEKAVRYWTAEHCPPGERAGSDD